MIFNPENFENNKSDWVTTFPIYNATETNRQKYVDKYVWEFNSDNSITSELMSSNVYPDKAAESDIKYGTTYEEAKQFTKDNKTVSADLTGSKIIQTSLAHIREHLVNLSMYLKLNLLVYMAIIMMAVRILLRRGMACQRHQV